MLFIIYATIATFAFIFCLDLAATLYSAWLAAAPQPDAKNTIDKIFFCDRVQNFQANLSISAIAPTLPDPWKLPHPIATAPATPQPAISAQLLLPPAKPTSPTTIASKQPQPAPAPKTTPNTILQVLTVVELRKKATAAGIKNAGRMKKNQLLAALAV